MTVVVGVDNSKASGAALRLAAQEARWRQVPLVAVSAYEPPHAPAGGFPGAAMHTEGEERAAAEATLRATVNNELGDQTGETDLRISAGLAGRVIIEAARQTHAQLVVLQAHPGVTMEYVLLKARCPVTIVPDEATGGEKADRDKDDSHSLSPGFHGDHRRSQAPTSWRPPVSPASSRLALAATVDPRAATRETTTRTRDVEADRVATVWSARQNARRGGSEPVKSDSEIREDVINELRWDPQVTAPEAIGVAVRDGAVTLTGHVPTYVEKLAAARAAERVYGVKAVANDLEVKLAGVHRDDTDIATAIAHVLDNNVQVPAGKVQARVQNGWVTLDGEVGYDYQRREVERMVRQVRGVTGVSDLITVKPPVSLEAVEAKIEDAFKREAEIDARHVRVEVSDHTAKLYGHVHSLNEAAAARAAAASAAGVATVESHLVVSP